MNEKSLNQIFAAQTYIINLVLNKTRTKLTENLKIIYLKKKQDVLDISTITTTK